MIKSDFSLRHVTVAILTLLSFGSARAQFPSLPPTLSTSVTPNVLMLIDNSGSMDNPPSGGTTKKITTAKSVAKSLIAKNPNLRWGIFSFDPGSDQTSGVLQASVGSTSTELNDAIDSLSADTWTPLAETFLEMTRYFAGESSYYSKISGSYTSPIQYRCQKNFAIVITDGDATKDNRLPGGKEKPTSSERAKLSYKSYNASGVQVDRTFGICQSSSTVNSFVTCPAVLEGSSTAAGSGDNKFVLSDGDYNNYQRALRDVVMYANDRDFKVAGSGAVDADAKSWDDPKFAKQNITTYTVGFDVNNDVLKATATVGGGKYYTANNAATLESGLQAAVDSIVASISNAGGVAVQSEVSATGNKLFQPVFNPSGWYGELRCFEFDSGSVTGVGAACSPNAIAVIPSATNRKIFTSKPSGTTPTTIKFDFKKENLGSMSSVQKTALGSTDAVRKNVIDFVRGVEGISGFRSRYNANLGKTVLLGDIVDGQPVAVSAPKGSTSDAAYATFKSDNSSRNIVFVGANDGMLHAFRVGPSAVGGSDNLTEIMGYVPSAVYPRLPSLTKTDYGGATPHVYHVNGVLRYEDVKLSGQWTTLVVGGLAQGGQSYFAIDAKNETTLGSASTAVKWEFTDSQSSDLGYSFGAPIIYNVRTSSTTVVPAVIASNGFESSYDDTSSGGVKASANSSVLYIINAETGVLIKAISVPGGTGLSAPAGVDVGQDGILDYVYAGDVSGKLWRFDLTDDNPLNFKVVATPIFDAGTNSPIVMRPAVIPINSSADGASLGNVVLFGTGKLITDADRTSTATQSLYGILDKMEASPTTVPNTFTTTSLVEQTIVGTVTNNQVDSITDGTYRLVSDNFIDLRSPTNTRLGWALRLPDQGERLVTSPLVYSDKVIFGTGTPFTAEKCLPGGVGWVLGLNPLTGSITRKGNSPSGTAYSFVDLNGDSKSTVAGDQLSFGGSSYFPSGFKKDGIPTEQTFVYNSASLNGPADPTSNTYGALGAVMALRESNSMAVYTANGRGTETVGTPMKRPDASGGGRLCGGVIGTADLDCRGINGAPTNAARLSTTVWREIK